MVFNVVFYIISVMGAAIAPSHVSCTSAPKTIRSKPLAAFTHVYPSSVSEPLTITGERGTNPVAMSIINLMKEIGRAAIKPETPLLKSCMPLTELSGLDKLIKTHPAATDQSLKYWQWRLSPLALMIVGITLTLARV